MLPLRSAYRHQKYIPWIAFSWVEWLGNKTKEIKKVGGHINLPSKIFQSHDTTIILKTKLSGLLSAT